MSKPMWRARCGRLIWMYSLGLGACYAPIDSGWSEENTGSITDPIDRVETTTTRSPSPNLSTPYTVIQKTATDLDRSGLGLSLDEFLDDVPGLYFQNQYNFVQNLRVSIRGFGARAAFGVRGLQVLSDGFPETLPDGQSQVDGIDLESTQAIAVIKGPASALYGNGAGGVIAVYSEDGQDRIPGAQIDLSFGEDGLRRVGVQAGGEWDQWHGWLSAWDLKWQGARAHQQTHKQLANVQWVQRLNEERQMRWVMTALNQPYAKDPGALTWEQVQSNRWQAAPQAEALNAGQSVDQQRLGWRYAWGPVSGRRGSVYAFVANRDFRQQLPSSFFPSLIVYDRLHWGVGGLWRGQWSDWAATWGLDWASQSDDRARFRVDGRGVPLAQTQDELQQATSRAIFTQWSRAVGPFGIWFGGRWDEVELSIVERNNATSSDRRFSQLSTMAGFTGAVSQSSQWRLTRAESFEGPTFTEIKDVTGTGGFSRDLAPAKAVNYELSFDHQTAREVLRTSLFRTDSRDEIVNTRSVGGIDVYDNAGATRREGWEVSWQRDWTDRIRTSVAYTWARYEFRHFTVLGESFRGQQLPGLPRNQWVTELLYRWADRSQARLKARYLSDVYADNANETRVAGYGLIDFDMEWPVDPAGQRVVAWGVNNVLDERYFSNIRINAARGAYYEPGPGRTWYVGLRWAL